MTSDVKHRGLARSSTHAYFQIRLDGVNGLLDLLRSPIVQNWVMGSVALVSSQKFWTFGMTVNKPSFARGIMSYGLKLHRSAYKTQEATYSSVWWKNALIGTQAVPCVFRGAQIAGFTHPERILQSLDKALPQVCCMRLT